VEVIVPYTHLRQETVDALKETGHYYIPVDVSSSDHAYFDLLSSLWEKKESFILVEHDVVVGPSTLDELEACSSRWCSVTVDYFWSHQAHGLACAKFTYQMMLNYPGLMAQVGSMYDAGHPPKHWCRLDAWITRTLPVLSHVHYDHLKHIRDYTGPVTPTHGCESEGRIVPSFL
jgi:hypothetical protein